MTYADDELGADAGPDIELLDTANEWAVPAPDACAYVYHMLSTTVRDLDYLDVAPKHQAGMKRLQKRLARLGRILAGEPLDDDAKRTIHQGGLLRKDITPDSAGR